MLRPCAMTSRVVSIFASSAGLRYGTPTTSSPMRMREVLAAIAPRATKQSKTGTSFSGLLLVRKHEVIGQPDRIEAGLLTGTRCRERGIPMIAVCARRVAAKLLSHQHVLFLRYLQRRRHSKNLTEAAHPLLRHITDTAGKLPEGWFGGLRPPTKRMCSGARVPAGE